MSHAKERSWRAFRSRGSFEHIDGLVTVLGQGNLRGQAEDGGQWLSQRDTKEIESLTHDEARRRNIPTAEMQSFYEREPAAAPMTISYPRATPLAPGETRERNPDLDPQLVWRGKDEQDWSDLVVHAPPLYIQEKVHPKVIIEDLRRADAAAPRRGRRRARPVRRLQRPAGHRSEARVLPARPELVEPHDPRRQPAGDGEPRRARGPARPGPVHLHRPALRHPLQLQLAGLDPLARRQGRQARTRSAASRSRSRRSATPGRTASTPI